MQRGLRFIADALQLAPGEAASIELVATQRLSMSRDATYQLVLSALAGVEAQALLVDQADIQFLVVVPHRSSRGTARLTLRPNGAASETIDLGVLSDPSGRNTFRSQACSAASARSGAIDSKTIRRTASLVDITNAVRADRRCAGGHNNVAAIMPNTLNAG